MRGPAAVATPPRPDHAPIARGRSAGRNDAWMMARLPGVSRAPPIPWTTRATMRNPALGAMPQSAEATANHAMPSENMRRRPKRSPSDPPSNKKAASVSE